MLIVLLLLYGSFLFACALEAITVVLAVVKLWKRDARNGFLLFVTATALFISLWSLPKLEYYVGYGIRSKVLLYRQTVPWILVAAVIPSVFVRGKAKWPPLVAVTIVGVLLFFLSR
jgi:hypothetical protein